MVVFVVAVRDRGEMMEFPGVVFSQVPILFPVQLGFRFSVDFVVGPANIDCLAAENNGVGSPSDFGG